MEYKKVAGIALAGLVAGGLGTGLIVNEANNSDAVIEQLQLANAALDNHNSELQMEKVSALGMVDALQLELDVVEALEPVIVEVESENLQLVLDHIYDNDGSVEYLLDDLDDDEVNEIVSRIVFINDVKSLAVEWVKDNGVDELDREYVGEERLDEDDIERFKVYNDDDEVVIDDADFKDYDADAIVKVRFEQDDIDYVAWYNVEFKDGELDDGELLSVELRE